MRMKINHFPGRPTYCFPTTEKRITLDLHAQRDLGTIISTFGPKDRAYQTSMLFQERLLWRILSARGLPIDPKTGYAKRGYTIQTWWDPYRMEQVYQGRWVGWSEQATVSPGEAQLRRRHDLENNRFTG